MGNLLPHGRGPHGATHPPWAFRREAAMWNGDMPIGPNMLPLAGEMCDWLGQKCHGLSACLEENRGKLGFATNPYTYYASAIGTSLGEVINSVYAFVESTDDVQPIEAEVTRVRLQSELALYTARFCEATIKQMLYCTQVPSAMYENVSLGKLLATDCKECRKADKPGHDISLLGALAHQYHLCHTLEHCMADHLAFVGKRRNEQAAHAQSILLDPKGVSQSRERLKGTLNEIGHEFGHMVEHIGQIETRMIEEISLINRYYPEMPPMQSYGQIHARPRSVARQSNDGK